VLAGAVVELSPPDAAVVVLAAVLAVASPPLSSPPHAAAANAATARSAHALNRCFLILPPRWMRGTLAEGA
jgi:hypothetical protein